MRVSCWVVLLWVGFHLEVISKGLLHWLVAFKDTLWVKPIEIRSLLIFFRSPVALLHLSLTPSPTEKINRDLLSSFRRLEMFCAEVNACHTQQEGRIRGEKER